MKRGSAGEARGVFFLLVEVRETKIHKHQQQYCVIECDLYIRSRNVILQPRTGVSYGGRRCLICP